MDANRFDTIARVVGSPPDRRDLLKAAAVRRSRHDTDARGSAPQGPCGDTAHAGRSGLLAPPERVTVWRALGATTRARHGLRHGLLGADGCLRLAGAAATGRAAAGGSSAVLPWKKAAAAAAALGRVVVLVAVGIAAAHAVNAWTVGRAPAGGATKTAAAAL
jgi:hypothetical protein